jgi:hypothetical protein
MLAQAPLLQAPVAPPGAWPGEPPGAPDEPPLPPFPEMNDALVKLTVELGSAAYTA